MDLQKTADDARKLLRGFKAIEDLAKAFEDTASLVQAASEAQRTLDKLRADIGSAQDQLEQARAASNAAVKDAKEQAARLLAEARADAKAVRESAAEAAKRATAAADKKVKEAEDAATAAQAEGVRAVEAKLVAERELAGLEERIAKARATIAELLKQE